MKTYQTALSPIISVPFVIIFATVIPTFIANKIWFGLAVNCAVLLFVIHMYLTTRYTIDQGHLHIVSGFLYKKAIPLYSIISISSSRNPISSPAFSLDRLEVRYGTDDYVLISPKQKEEFLKEIQLHNSNIRVKSVSK
ncbi:MAG: PH domain-containing protein [Bacteroidota bacterium]